MSLEETISVECPNCQHEQNVVVWDSLNAQTSPEAKAQFLNGEINVFACEECAVRISLATPFLYHDMERQFCVQFYPPEALEEEATLRLYQPDGSLSSDYVFGAMQAAPELIEKMHYMLHPHVVFSMQEALNYVLFRENLVIFHEVQTSQSQ